MFQTADGRGARLFAMPFGREGARHAGGAGGAFDSRGSGGGGGDSGGSGSGSGGGGSGGRGAALGMWQLSFPMEEAAARAAATAGYV